MSVERIDKYTIVVDGHRVRADASQESRLRAMNTEQRDRFLTVMGLKEEKE